MIQREANAKRPLVSVDNHGWVPASHRFASPHFDERPQNADVVLLVIHNISLPPAQFGGPEIVDFFLGRLDHDAHPYFQTIRTARVSSHFLIRRDGELIQFVSCNSRAWHAGLSVWRGRERCNDFAIGIELEGTDDLPFEDAQYQSLADLTKGLLAAYPIEDVVGHSDIAPGRKTDPGPHFDWVRYRAMLKSLA